MFENKLTIREKIIIVGCAIVTSVVLLMLLIVLLVHNNKINNPLIVDIEFPDNYDKDYEEDAEAYAHQKMLDETDWNTLPMDEMFTSVVVSETVINSSFTGTPSVAPNSRTHSDEEIIMMPENEAWSLISNGLFTGYPEGSFNDNKDKLYKIAQTNTETIRIKCWYWEDPSDDSNFNKVTKEKVFAVNSALAQLYIHAFEDIYNDPSKPVLNLGDGGMGTWSIRGKNHNPNAHLSTHSLGSCIDINPSTGSFRVNGTWYGNAYGHQTMSEAIWKELPECHNKYHVLYDGCPIVEVFKSYGFVWGGDWSSTKDCMHLSFIGEGRDCRAKGQSNYLERK